MTYEEQQEQPQGPMAAAMDYESIPEAPEATTYGGAGGGSVAALHDAVGNYAEPQAFAANDPTQRPDLREVLGPRVDAQIVDPVAPPDPLCDLSEKLPPGERAKRINACADVKDAEEKAQEWRENHEAETARKIREYQERFKQTK